jgi:hypothetical protein
MFGDGFCLENACELRRTSFFTRNTFHTKLRMVLRSLICVCSVLLSYT